MASIEEIKAAAYQVWPSASYIDIDTTEGVRPKLTAMSSDGIVIWRFESENLSDMFKEVQRRHEAKEQVP